MKETLKKYSPKPENINLGWFNKHLTNPEIWKWNKSCLLYTSPSPRDRTRSRMPSSA